MLGAAAFLAATDQSIHIVVPMTRSADDTMMPLNSIIPLGGGIGKPLPNPPGHVNR